MSVEAPKPVEETPVTKPVAVPEPVEAPVSETPAVVTEPTTAEPAVETIKTSDDKVVVEATPASEGQLGYKAPGFLKQFVFSKQYFWLKEEPSTAESLKAYLGHEKPETAHSHAAWAQETSAGVLYHAKRAEDKTHPLGLILLADATNVVKEGATEFSFIVNKKAHRFEAATTAERDSWIVAIEKQIQESQAIKDEVTGRETYKKTLEDLTAAPTVAAAAKTERSSSKAPKKSLDATTATAAAAEPAAKDETASVSSSDKEKKAEKAAKKERSQSRKRQSVFGIFSKKDEDKEQKKAEKEVEKAEKEVKKAEAEQIKTDKHAEAEAKKEEAKETHEAAPAVEAVEAAAIAAAPATVVAAVENKKEEKHAKEAETEAASPTEKSRKRSSVFGIFTKKITSPTTEKSEKEAVAPAESTEVPPVSETAPKLDEPIENKPIDAAAVTAPVDTVETPAAAPVVETEEPAKEAAAPTTETPAGKSEKKGGLLSFIKKNDPRKEQKEVQKEIQKEEAEEKKAAEPISSAAAPATAPEAPVETAAVDTPAAETTTADERAAREKRRSSFFGLGSKKKPAASADAADGEGAAGPEVKREKSPLPARIGGLFRKSSKTVKPAETEAATTEAVPAETAVAEVPAPEAPVAGAAADAPVVGDTVPAEGPATVHDATTVAPTEVKASA